MLLRALGSFGILTALLGASPLVHAQSAYQLDDGSREERFNNSSGNDTEDNWVANSFRVTPFQNVLTGITFQLGENYTNRPITALIYTGTSLTDPHAGSGLTRVSTTTTTVTGTNGQFVTIPIDPLTLPVDQVFWAALLLRGVPANQFPFSNDLDNPLGRSWFDVGPAQGAPYNVDNTNNARVFGAMNHPVVPCPPGVFCIQDPGNLLLRVEATPEPTAITLLGIGTLGLLCHAWRRRRAV
jgi:hypothetical protein